MTLQVPDEVWLGDARYAITAVEGNGLFDPERHGLTPSMLSTACWRGFICRYAVRAGTLVLAELEIGLTGEADLAGTAGTPARAGDFHSSATFFRDLRLPVGFTGRLLLGADPVRLGRLHMGFRPAWLYADVREVVADGGRITAVHDRSAAASTVRERLGEGGLGPADGEETRDWVERTFSLGFAYSWPGP